MKIVLIFTFTITLLQGKILQKNNFNERKLTSNLQEHEGIEVYKFINYEYKTYIRDLFLEALYDSLQEFNDKEKLPEENIYVGTGEYFNLILQSPKIEQVLKEKSLKQFMQDEEIAAAEKTVYNDVIDKWTMYFKKNQDDNYASFKASISFKEDYNEDAKGVYDGVIHITIENPAYSKKIQIYATGRRNNYLKKFVKRNVKDFFVVQRQIINDFSSFKDDVEHLLKLEFTNSQFKLIEKHDNKLQLYDIDSDESLKSENIYLEQNVEDFDKVPSKLQFLEQIEFDAETNDPQINFYMVKLNADQLTDDFYIYVKKQFGNFLKDSDVQLKVNQNFLCYRLFPLLEDYNNPIEIMFLLHQDVLYYQIQNEYVTIKKLTQQITYRAVMKILEKNITNFKKQYLFQRRFENQQFGILDKDQEDLTPYYNDFNKFLEEVNKAQLQYEITYESATDLAEQNHNKKDYEFTYKFNLRFDDAEDIDEGERAQSLNIQDEVGEVDTNQPVEDEKNKNEPEETLTEKQQKKKQLKEQGYDVDSIFHQEAPIMQKFSQQENLNNIFPDLYNVHIKKCYPYFTQFNTRTYLLATEQKFALILSQININYFKDTEAKNSQLLNQLEEYGNPLINKGLRKNMMTNQAIEGSDFQKELVFLIKEERMRHKKIKKIYVDYVWKINN